MTFRSSDVFSINEARSQLAELAEQVVDGGTENY